MLKAQPGVSGAMDAGSVWGAPAGRGDAPGGIGLPPGLQQQQHMLPREAAPGPEEDDDINDLLGNLGVESAPRCPSLQIWPHTCASLSQYFDGSEAASCCQHYGAC